MATYKLLALDMDGTLLDSRKNISPRTAQALERLAARGVAICLCTGRNVAELGPYLDVLGFARFGVLVSGALVRDLVTGEVLGARPLTTQQALGALEVGLANDAMTHLLAVHESVVTNRDLARLEDVQMEIYRPLYENYARHVDDVRAAVEELDGEVLKVNLYHTSPALRDKSHHALESSGLVLADVEITSLECSPAGVSKSLGLQTLCAHLECSMDEVVMVGDSENDREALESVGMPVAMGNAEPQIARLAKLVVADNDHDGIAEAVERLFG